MEPWVLFTLAAASIQIGRTVLQKNMTARLSVRGSAYARFLYGLPIAVILLAVVHDAAGVPLPTPNAAFIAYVLVGSVFQSISSALFIYVLTHTNLAIGWTLAKTETVFAAAFSFVVLGDRLSPPAAVGMVVTLLGCMVIGAGRQHLSLRNMIVALASRAAAQGMAIGALYAFTSTSNRAATLALDGGTPQLNAVAALACSTVVQMVLFGAYLAIRERGVLREVIRSWRPGFLIGLTAVCASACWFVAFALKETAYVLAVGTADVVLVYLVSRYLYREHTNRVEIAGILITVAGILCVAFAR